MCFRMSVPYWCLNPALVPLCITDKLERFIDWDGTACKGLQNGHKYTDCAFIRPKRNLYSGKSGQGLQEQKSYKEGASSLNLLSVPRHCSLSFGSRVFRVSAPKIWNSLAPHVLQSQTLDSFRRHLKTYYFQSACPSPMRPDSLLRLWRYINHLLTYLHLGIATAVLLQAGCHFCHQTDSVRSLLIIVTILKMSEVHTSVLLTLLFGW